MIAIVRHGDVTRLRLSSVGGMAAGYDVSAYVYRDVLIDSGFHRARADLVQAIDELDIQGAMITHWHEDHAGNAELLAARGVPLAARHGVAHDRDDETVLGVAERDRRLMAAVTERAP